MRPVLTRQGVEVDYCPACKGVWLDKGEIFHFTRWRKELSKTLQNAQANPGSSSRMSPRTGKPMQQLSFLAGRLQVEFCAETGGLWFDAGELRKLAVDDSELLSLQPDEARVTATPKATVDKTDAPPAKIPPLSQLPNLALRSSMTIFGIYALVTLILMLCVEFAGLEISVAVAIGFGFAVIQFIATPWLMDLSLSWFYNMQWVDPGDLPDHLQAFVAEVCRRQGMRVPSFGLIYDGGPNAFTYGHTPNNARIILTQGLLDLLAKDEVEAVVAHEIGHARHWDMLLMTVVQMVPLILYYIFRWLVMSKSGSQKGKGSGKLAIVGVLAYFFYFLSEYMVLWFSRTREYWADRFAGQVTGKPNDLAAALVKIAYGLAGREQRPQTDKKKTAKAAQRAPRMEAIGALGISNPQMSRAFAVSTYADGGVGAGVAGPADQANIVNAMKWDLWNPWAEFFEMHSTHPLVARRLRYLGNQAEAMGQAPFIRFSIKKPESYWDEFFGDLVIMLMPFAAFAGFTLTAIVTQELWLLNLGLAVAGALSFFKLYFTYPQDVFPEYNVAGLLKRVKVSGVRAVPCRLKGRIIGRGVPGLIWSEDFILQDDTGIIFLDYGQPLRIWEFLFGLTRSREFRNTAVELEGWYRRSPVPYVELKRLRTSKRVTTHCYVYTYKRAVAVLMVIAGLLLPMAQGYKFYAGAFKKDPAPVQHQRQQAPPTEWTAEQQAARHISAGYDFYIKAKFAEASAEYNQALEIEPDNQQAYFYRGLVFIKTREYDRALADLKGSIELDPRHFDSYLYLDWLLTRQGDGDRVVQSWSAFIQLEPENARAYLERGGAYYHLGNQQAARADAKKSCELGNAEGCLRFRQLSPNHE